MGNLFTVLIIIFFLVGACVKKEKADISKINLELTFQRFEQDLFSIPFDSIKNEVPDLYNKYGEFFNIFNYAIIKIGDFNSPAYPEYLKMYITDFLVNKIYQESQVVFDGMIDIEEDLTNAFKHYAYYFPEKDIPNVYTFIGRDLSHASIATDEKMLAIAIDKYMGKDCKLYYQSGFYKYMIENMVPNMIVPDAMRGWLYTEFPFNDSTNNVLNNMIYEGRALYVLRRLLPEVNDTIFTGFSEDQLRFCKNNEYMMWNYLVEYKVLFSTDYLTINKFINPAPYTKDFTSESPARAAVWLGWQITESFMKKNSSITLQQLMEMDDYQYILEHSSYNP